MKKRNQNECDYPGCTIPRISNEKAWKKYFFREIPYCEQHVLERRCFSIKELYQFLIRKYPEAFGYLETV